MATIQTGGGQNKLPQPEQAHYSTFDQLSKHIYTTGRFGENQVCCVMNAITGDNIKIRNEHKLTTYTLSAPLMTPIYMEKDFFLVPRQAILPWNWEKIYQQPNIGEDINPVIIGTSISAVNWNNFTSTIANEAKGLYITLTQTAIQSIATALQYTELLLKYVIVTEYIYSYGSLLNNMGCKMAAIWKQYIPGNQDNISEELISNNFDQAFEKIWSRTKYGFRFYWNDNTEKKIDVLGPQTDTTHVKNAISVNDFLTQIRDSADWTLETVWTDDQQTEPAEDAQGYTQIWKPVFDALIMCTNIRNDYAEPVDLARVWAYQIINAEYFTNDKVDYIYSAELYRQYIGNIIEEEVGFNSFTWNGINYQYDYLSAYYFGILSDVTVTAGLKYLAALFSYKRSLKYLDYFTGSKTRPLGVGDFNVNPDELGRVNVIDITRKIQAQRFANAVNRIGRKAEDYAKSLFGVNMKRDMHTPIWLGSTRDIIRSSETENTGDAQISTPNAVTSRLESYGGNSQFEIEVDRDGIIIGIYFFDLERSYSRSIHRSFMHVNRYDMYNPYLQYTGDQEIKAAEYDASLEANGEQNIFGYVPAYEEFKQDFNEAQGGFVTALPGYTFIDGMEKNNGRFRPTQITQGPDFIRQKPVELDRYYNSLTGHSLANYFHFIIDFYNEIDAKRPMSYNPQIL